MTSFVEAPDAPAAAVIPRPAPDLPSQLGTAGRRAARAGYGLVLSAVLLVSLSRLVLGATVVLAQHSAAVLARSRAATGNTWAHGIALAAGRGEPLPQAVLEYAFSLLDLGLAVMVLRSRRRTWSSRLLGLAMAGIAGTCNLSVQATASTVRAVVGLPAGADGDALLQGTAFASLLLALVMFPWIAERRLAPIRRRLLLAGTAGLGFAGLLATLLPSTVSYVAIFGAGLPVAGLIALRRRQRDDVTARERVQLRLLFSMLLAAATIAGLLAVITVLLWSTGWRGLTMLDPTVGGERGLLRSSALLFWFSRLVPVAVAVSALVAARWQGLFSAERKFSQGLVVSLVATQIGGVFILVHTIAYELSDRGNNPARPIVSIVSALPAALGLYPVYLRVERWVDRLLYGVRPTPYSVLAGIGALSRSSTVNEPDLSRVAEAVGRGLGAQVCRLTVNRPGLRERTYVWDQPGLHHPDELVDVPIRLGDEPIGSLTVDRAAVAGLQRHRQHLLEDIADSLGAVLQASRLEIELERQLRAARAHAGDIAASRRRVVAEMDAERRRIERDLHDGAQHHLVSLRMALGLVEHQVLTSQLDRASDSLSQIAEKINVAESILAQTATGVSSPLLAELGLVGALDKELRDGEPPVLLDADGAGQGRRFPAELESAVWFCCLEAVNNARKHAPGAAIGVELRVDHDELCFTVTDDGPGWDVTAVGGSPGRGLRNVIARISGAGGRVDVRSAPGSGTTIVGAVPIPAAEAAGPVATEDPPAAEQPAGQAHQDAGLAGLAGLAGTGPGETTGSQHPEQQPGGQTAGQPVLLPGPQALFGEVRDVLEVAQALYAAGPGAQHLSRLAESLDEPLQVCVLGPVGVGTSTLVRALTYRPGSAGGTGSPAAASSGDDGAIHIRDWSAEAAQPALERSAGEGAGDWTVTRPDVFVVLMRQAGTQQGITGHPALPGGADRFRRARTIGVLARADEITDLSAPDVDPYVTGGVLLDAVAHCASQVADLCRFVVPVAGLIGCAAITLDEPRYQALIQLGGRSGAGPGIGATFGEGGPAPEAAAPAPRELPGWLGDTGLRLASRLVQSGAAPTRQALAEALAERSGLVRLQELVDVRFVQRSAPLKAWSVLSSLDVLVREEPPRSGADRLLHRIERIRSSAHELMEIDAIDALRSGEYELASADLEAAARMLGESGSDPRTRLGLEPGADQLDVTSALTEVLTAWRRRASHPGTTRTVRALAVAVVQSCEQILHPS